MHIFTQESLEALRKMTIKTKQQQQKQMTNKKTNYRRFHLAEHLCSCFGNHKDLRVGKDSEVISHPVSSHSVTLMSVLVFPLKLCMIRILQPLLLAES